MGDVQTAKDMKLSSTPSLPQQTPNEATDFEAEYRRRSVNGTGSTQDEDERVPWETPPEDAAPSYWHTQLYTLPAFLRRPRKQWTVDKVFGAGDFVLLYGESGHGKTHAALDLAFSCATGRTFADVFTVTRPLTVAYCTGEGIGGLADRLRAVSNYYSTEDVPLYVFTDIPQLFTPTQPNGAVAFLAAWQEMAQDGLVPAQLDVLVLDTLHNATAGADENSAKDAGLVQASMRKLRDTLGCTNVLVHHAGKNGANERGSSAIRASADTVLRATKVGNSYTLACEKLKDGEAWQAQAFSLVCPPGMPDGVRVSWDGDAKSVSVSQKSRKSQALTWLQENADWHTASEVAQAIDEESKAIYEYLNALTLAGDVECKTGRPKLFCAKVPKIDD
jgi:hypothetical protein